jgi:hypothetical protein
MEFSYYEKYENRPYSKKSRLENSKCICPQSSKTLFMNMVKKSGIIESTLSRIALF